ncbi:hypothetical protein Tco_1071017 [Tanacetum coccineum]|uniref:Reverse transcriptase n=1 Tax=Tanacetum coccineum TaxID=301880 RepID=A0ABQ5HN40_9ASTR
MVPENESKETSPFFKACDLHEAINMDRDPLSSKQFQNVTCIECGEKDISRIKCPNAGTQQNDGARRESLRGVEKSTAGIPNVLTEVFDAIIRMDWLAYHRALIDCYEKIVRIPLPNGKILEVQGERPEKDLRSLACIKADEKKLDDIRASPVVRSPYRLALSEMLELSNQLKELQEKGYSTKSLTMGSPGSLSRRNTFLGHVVNRDGIHVDPSKVESVKNWKTPESSTEIRSFLGLAGYYPKGDKQDEAFQILKEKLCNAPVLALPDGPDDFSGLL